MKYAIRELTEDYIYEELEQVRKQFVDALTYTMETANISFDKKASDPLDIYIKYDFQQKHGKDVVYGFNLREEIIKSFMLEGEKTHASIQLLKIGKDLQKLANEIESRYDADPEKTLADDKDKTDKKEVEFATNVNRSYREMLKDAILQDETLLNARSLVKK